MKNYVITIQYDGSQFCGFQKQETKRTVQGEIEKGILELTGEKVKIEGSGRTDKGVHAIAQVCHFEANFNIEPKKFHIAMKHFLPSDVSITHCEIKENFHARYHAKAKTYIFNFFSSQIVLPLKEKYAVRVGFKLNFEIMKKAASEFVGIHDFTSFCLTESQKNSNVRTIYECFICQKDDIFTLEITGNGFLHNMVRIIAGTIVDAGRGKIEISDIARIIEAKNRNSAGKTLEAHGLFLKSVLY